MSSHFVVMSFFVWTMSTVVATGCSSWPPYKAEIEAHFVTIEGDLNELHGLLRQEDSYLVEQYESSKPVVQLFRDAERVRTDSEWAKQVGDSIADMGVNQLYRAEDNYFVVLNASGDDEHRRYQWGYAVGPESLSPRCMSEMRSSRCGRCSIQLNASWRIFYRWHPTTVADVEKFCTEPVFD
ncbi:MAG: hypothetical protein AAGJ56_10810 [Myxococcota bacterium]